MALNTNSQLSRNADPYAGITIRTAYDPLRGNYDYYHWTGDPSLAPQSLRGAPPRVNQIDMNSPTAASQSASDNMQAWITQNRAAAAELNARLSNPGQNSKATPMARQPLSARVNTPTNYTGPNSTLGRGYNQPVRNPGFGSQSMSQQGRMTPPSGSNMGGMPSQVGGSARPMGADQSWLEQSGGQAFQRPDQMQMGGSGGFREFPRGNANGSVSGGFYPYGSGAGSSGGGMPQPQPMSGRGSNPMWTQHNNQGMLGPPSQMQMGGSGGFREFPRGNADGSVSGGYYPPQQQQPPMYQGGGMSSGGGGFASSGYPGIAPAGYNGSSGGGFQMGQPEQYQFGTINGMPFGTAPPPGRVFGPGGSGPWSQYIR